MRDSILVARRGISKTNPDGTIVAEFLFSASDPTFAGHFPTRPILPGIFQLEMARLVAEDAAQRPLQIAEVTKAKFLWPITPEETIRLELKLVEKADAIQARANFIVSGRSAGETILQLVSAP
jgi:3-hydroxymyristoyl/3-hydroxydecanoyl-(acyl carrier protein) dehydratase